MKYIVFSLSFFITMSIFGQSILNATSPTEYRKLRDENKKVMSNGDTVNAFSDPLPYGYIEPKDELWSKMTWEVIDLNERINQVYYHNSDGLMAGNVSLFEAIKSGLKKGEINEVFNDDSFKEPISSEEALSRLIDNRIDDFGLQDLLNQGIQPTAEDSLDYSDAFEVRNSMVRMLMINGLWYIDKRLGEMRYRLLGIAIMGPDAKTVGTGIEGAEEQIPLFWIWYPDARGTLSKYQAFNEKNNSARVSFDDLLNARMFNSIIYKTERTGTGAIEEYLPADSEAQLRESQRIKNSILENENEMWTY